MIIFKIYKKEKEYILQKNEFSGIWASVFNRPSSYRPFETKSGE